MNAIQNPKLYRRLSAPHVSKEKFADNLQKFCAGLYRLRKRCKFADVSLIILDSYDDGTEEQPVLIHQHYGDSSKTEGMLATALGEERRRRQRLLDSLGESERKEEQTE